VTGTGPAGAGTLVAAGAPITLLTLARGAWLRR